MLHNNVDKIYSVFRNPYTTRNDQTSYDYSRVSAPLIIRVSSATWSGLSLLISYRSREEIVILVVTEDDGDCLTV